MRGAGKNRAMNTASVSTLLEQESETKWGGYAANGTGSSVRLRPGCQALRRHLAPPCFPLAGQLPPAVLQQPLGGVASGHAA